MYIVLIPYRDDVLVFFVGMYGGRREGMHVPYGMTTLPILYVLYSREGIGQTMIASCDLLFPHVMSCFHFMRTLLEQVMDGRFGEHLAYERILSFVCVTNGGGDELKHSPYQLLEDKQHFGGEDCNVPN